MNLISLLGNIIVIPFVSVMMIMGAMSVILGPYLSWLPFISVEIYLLKTVYAVASRSAHVGLYLQVESMWVRGIVVIVLLVFYGVVSEETKRLRGQKK